MNQQWIFSSTWMAPPTAIPYPLFHTIYCSTLSAGRIQVSSPTFELIMESGTSVPEEWQVR